MSFLYVTNLGKKDNVRRCNVRASNMEMLRIVAMILVLIVHANFLSLGKPTQDEILSQPFFTFWRFFIQSLSLICVNVFIFISGWFGIRPCLKRFCELLFQVLFIIVSLYVINLCVYRDNVWGWNEWWYAFTFFKGNWFVLSYIVLYVLSPILNVFSEKASRQQYKNLLMGFFIVQTLFGFIHNTGFFSYGYSPLSFIGLYLLARYVRLYPNKLTGRSKIFDICTYIGLSLFTTICSMILSLITQNTDRLVFSYTSPLVIVAALHFFLLFTKIKLQNGVVNWVASSAFAVFLLHTDSLFFIPYYLEPIKRCFINESFSMFLVNTTMRIFCVYVIAILIDKIRIFIWQSLCRLYYTITYMNVSKTI